MERKPRICLQSVGGLRIPPRRRFKPLKCLILRFSIEGIIPSKKNRQIARRNVNKMHSTMKRWYGQPFTPEMEKEIFEVSKPYIAHSKGFVEWEAACRADLAMQASNWLESHQKSRLTYPIKSCSIAIYHYWKDRIIRDTSGKVETINDILVDLRIIESDGAHCRRSGKDEADVYKGEINNHITHITISAYAW